MSKTPDIQGTREQLMNQLGRLRLRAENAEDEQKHIEQELRRSLADFAESQRVAHLGGCVSMIRKLDGVGS